MKTWILNNTINRNRYKTADEAVIISCFYNPHNNPYRLIAFQKWYESIKHLPHQITECLIGPKAKSQLPKSPFINQVRTENLLWHKETLLNNIIKQLPSKYKYVFWIDADVLFTNNNWFLEGTKKLHNANIIQPFSHCVHLNQNEVKPSFDLQKAKLTCTDSTRRHPSVWASFCYVHSSLYQQSAHENYNVHGHVGFAWGARREILERVPLYDKALNGGADHIIAHAAAGHIPHNCITKVYADNLSEVMNWSKGFYHEVNGLIDYVPGDLYHIWHGDIKKRNNYKSVKGFTKLIHSVDKKDKNGLYVGNNRTTEYLRQHFHQREATGAIDFDHMQFMQTMGYNLFDLFDDFNQPTYEDDPKNQDDVPHDVVESSVQETQDVPQDTQEPSINSETESPNFS